MKHVVPDHIPAELVYDLDIYNFLKPGEDFQITWDAVRKNLPARIFWTPRNEGHWVALEPEAIATVISEYSRFSNEHDFIPKNHDRQYPMCPLEMNPPESTPFRRLMMPPLMPNEMGPLMEKIRATTIRLIEGFVAKGECEFVEAFASQLPISVFLDLMDLPQEDAGFLRPLGNTITKGDPQERTRAQRTLEAYIFGWIVRRRGGTGTDLLSRIANQDIGGRKMTDAEAQSMGGLLMLAGLDTVVNQLGFFAMFLATSRSHRQQLINNSDLIKPATEEMLRRFSLSHPARMVAADTELSGAQLKAGEMVLCPTALYGLSSVDDPYHVDFHRKASPHLAFGNGVHICAGQHLARRELRIFLEEWLRLIPDFWIKEGTMPVIETGMVGGPARLELTWPVVAPSPAMPE